MVCRESAQLGLESLRKTELRASGEVKQRGSFGGRLVLLLGALLFFKYRGLGLGSPLGLFVVFWVVMSLFGLFVGLFALGCFG